MSVSEVLSWAPKLLAGISVGLLLGLVYFAHLRHTSARILSDASPGQVAAAVLMRIGLAALVFYVLTRFGSIAAIGGLAGFTIARNRALARIDGEKSQQ